MYQRMTERERLDQELRRRRNIRRRCQQAKDDDQEPDWCRRCAWQINLSIREYHQRIKQLTARR